MWKLLSGWRPHWAKRHTAQPRHAPLSSETLLSALNVARDSVRTGRIINTTWDIATAGGTWRLTATDNDLWGTVAKRQRLLHGVRAWCLYRGAIEMVVTTHVMRPPGVMVIGLSGEGPVTQAAIVDWYEIVDSKPVFDGPEWLTSEDIDDDIKSLLPEGAWELGREAADELSEAALRDTGVIEDALL